MSKLIASAFASAIDGLPKEIVYLPEGEHDIRPTVDGKPGAVVVKVPAAQGERIAANLQKQLEDRHKSNIRPWFDFEHKRGVASALPQSFRYEPGKGIMCAVEWTGAGKTAVEGKDFSYFSPEFLLGEDGMPSGIPQRGPLGGLVNEPAFRDIPRIAASDAATTEDHNHAPTMSKLIFAALAISAAAENAETEAVKAIDTLKVKAADADRLANENAELKKKVEAAEKEAAKVRKERADTLVKAALADGRIAPKDTETADKFRAKIEAGDTFAEEILERMPKSNPGLEKPVIQGGETNPGQTADIQARAAALVKAGDAKTLSEAVSIICASDPEAYSAYLASLS